MFTTTHHTALHCRRPRKSQNIGSPGVGVGVGVGVRVRVRVRVRVTNQKTERERERGIGTDRKTDRQTL